MLNWWRGFRPEGSIPRESRELPTPPRPIRYFRKRIGNLRWLLPGACFWLVACAGEPERPDADNAPTVTTGPGSALGTRALTVNGSIHPHGEPTTYFFEYGTTKDYGFRTAERPLPPRLAAYYHESWDEGMGGWDSWLTESLYTSGGPSGGYVRLAEPSQNDHNHDDGIGTLHLTKYLWCGRCLDPGRDPGPCLAAGDPDLRDAKVTVWVRGNDWKPNGSEVLWWSQAYVNVQMVDDPGWRASNWAYTGFLLTDFLLDGEWHEVDYRLWNDTSYWSFGGNNPTLQGGVARRYDYGSIDRVQGHLNDDFFHLTAFIDVENPPTGSIDFDEFQLVYRNESLVFPDNGGRLVTWPRDSEDDPAALTDGWRHGSGRMWKSAPDPGAPQEFVFAFERPVTIDTIQLHQNPEWPGKEVEVLVSEDNETYTSILKRTLPREGEPNANFAFTLDRGLAARAGHLKVRLLSGYDSRHWGLGEIEVFGDGAVMRTDDDLYNVNLDIEHLTPGTTYHYRLVATNGAGTAHGDDRTYALPADHRPLVKTGTASRIQAEAAKVEGRLNPMGVRTRFYFQYGTDTGYGLESAAGYAGLQVTPRLVFSNLTDLAPETTYHYRLVGENEQGVSYGDDATFTTAPAR